MTLSEERPPRVSVIALTRDRPDEFSALLETLAQQRMTDFEVIVVGAKPTVEDHGAPPALARRITYAQCRAQNISRSRNIGVELARSDIVAFIDDDATPEPGWLEALTREFRGEDVGAVGGFVRGRNGVDFQWRGVLVDRYGGHSPAAPEEIARVEISEDTEFFPTTVGVNSAFRRAALEEVGGFDENFHYFLDESDLCLRLQSRGWRLRLAPQAEVHHAYSASEVRRANRAPRDLFQIAASRVYYSRRHGRKHWIDRKIEEFCADQSERLRKFVQLGRLSRRQAEEVEARMHAGVAEGERRFALGAAPGSASPPDRVTPAEARFRPSDSDRRPRVALIASALNQRSVRRAARRLADRGCEVTVIDFELGARRLKVWFDDGIWRHVGGVLGRDRFADGLQTPSRSGRVRRELSRIAPQRDFDVLIRPKEARYRIGDLRPAPLTGPLRGYVAEPMRAGGARDVIYMLTT